MKQGVLFLCTGNSARSQMGEALLRRYAGDIFDVYSAGIKPKGIHPYTVKVMNEIGMDLSTHTSKSVQAFQEKDFIQTLITVCNDADQNCPVGWPGLKQRLHWSFEDPAAFQGTEEEKIAKFREIRDQMNRKVKDWLAEKGILVS